MAREAAETEATDPRPVPPWGMIDLRMKTQLNPDKIGAVASAICAVHCLLTGIAFGLLSFVGLGFIGSVAAEVGFISVAVIVGAWAIYHGIKKHHSWIPAGIFVLGLVCIGLSHFAFPHVHSGEVGANSSPFGTVFSVVGGLCLVSFHIVNLRMQRGCSCDSCTHVR